MPLVCGLFTLVRLPILACRTVFIKDTDEAGLANLIRFSAWVGCRQEEGASLELSQFNPRERTITFPKTKSGAPRVITVSPRTAAWLVGLGKPPAAPDGKRYFFRDLTGNRLNQPAQRFQRAHGRAAVPHSRFLDMRHTYGIRRLQADQRADRTDNQPRGIYELSRHLGHATTKTTEIDLAWLKEPPAERWHKKGAK